MLVLSEFTKPNLESKIYIFYQEMNKAKSESKKKKLEVGMKSFELMVKYCETANCRHAVFSRYFGDSIPQCLDR
jgi:ATP-dependent DNA helicase Q5